MFNTIFQQLCQMCQMLLHYRQLHLEMEIMTLKEDLALEEVCLALM